MAEKIVVIRAGRIEQIGKPLDLYDRSANTFVATFIGSPAMDLFEGVVGEGGFRIEGRRQSATANRRRHGRSAYLRHSPGRPGCRGYGHCAETSENPPLLRRRNADHLILPPSRRTAPALPGRCGSVKRDETLGPTV
jgi:hypothetical protein